MTLRLLTPEQVAEATQLNVVTVRRMCVRGELKATKLANQWRIYPAAYEEWLAAGEPEPGVAAPSERSVPRNGLRALVGGNA